LKSIFYTPGTVSVNVDPTVGGSYLVIFKVLVSSPDTATYAITVGGVAQANTSYSQSTDATGNLLLSGSAVINIPGGTPVTIRNVGTTINTLPIIPITITGAPAINASIQLIRLDIG